MRVLVLAATDEDPLLDAWRLQLRSEGVPATFETLAGRPPSPGTLEGADGRARYHAVVLLPSMASPAADGTGLVAAAATLGIRVVRYESGSWDAAEPGRPGSVAATDAGSSAWHYLRRRTSARPIDGMVLVADGAGTPLVTSSRDGSELLVHRELAALDIGEPILRHGIVSWLGGSDPRVGTWTPSLSVHVDDVLLGSDTWDPRRNRPGREQVRMDAADLRVAARWSDDNGAPIDLAINGAGSGGDECEPLLEALQQEQSSFRLVNHTFSHPDLDEASPRTFTREIVGNEDFARDLGLDLEPHELITGGHTGLRGQTVGTVLRATHIRVVGTDASRSAPPPQRGVAWVPRIPIGLAYDAPTKRLQVDEWNASGHPACRDDACDGNVDASWARGRTIEAASIVRHMVSGDARPLYAHQANLAGDATLLDLLTHTVRMFEGQVSTAIQHPSMTQVGELRLRLRLARAAFDDGGVTARRLAGGTLRLDSTRQVLVPITEPVADGERVSWVRVSPGQPVSVPPSRARPTR